MYKKMRRNHTKLAGVADTPDGCAVIHRDLDQLEKWAGRSHMKLNTGKCQVLWRSNPMHEDKLGPPSWKSAL